MIYLCKGLLPIQAEYNNTSRSNLRRVVELEGRGHQIEAAWIPGHCDFRPNEEADRVAKQAAAESTTVRYPAEKREVVVKLKEKVKENWQFRVDIKLANHRISSINRIVGTWFTTKIEGYHLLLQLASGHNQLNYHISKITDTTSPFCTCGQTEDASHFMYECECYSKHRFDLLMELNQLCETDLASLRHISWQVLLGQDTRQPKEVRVKVVKAVIDFVKRTGRFEKKR